MSLLDDLKENLGNSFGPHFWLTADDISTDKMVFLCEHYNIQTIKYFGANKWDCMKGAMNNICNQSRGVQDTLQMTSMSYDLMDWCELVITNKPLRTPIKRKTSIAMAATEAYDALTFTGAADTCWRAVLDREGDVDGAEAAAQWSLCLDKASKEAIVSGCSDARQERMMSVTEVPSHASKRIYDSQHWHAHVFCCRCCNL